MVIFSPVQNDFNYILDEIGQSITIRIVSRTVNNDGLVTAISNSDTSITALVDEVDDKRFDLLESGYYDVGDVRFHIDPDTLVSIFDKVIWNSEIYGVRKINMPQKIAGHYPYMELHCVRDTDV